MNWPVVLQTASAMIGAATFVYGVGAWRRNIVGQKKIDIAVQTIIAFKEVEQAYREIRNPASSSSEGSTRQQRAGESSQDAAVASMVYIAIERINNRSEKFVTLDTLRNLHQVYFGKEHVAPFEKMASFRWQITRAALRLEHHWKKQGQHFRTDEEFQDHLKKMNAAEEVFWEDYGNPDPINPQVKQVVEEVEEFCRSIIEPAPTFRILLKNTIRAQKRFWLG